MVAKIEVRRLAALGDFRSTVSKLLSHAEKVLPRGTEALNKTKSATSPLVQQLATLCFVDWTRPRFSKSGCGHEEGMSAGFVSLVGHVYQIVADIGCPIHGAKIHIAAEALLLNHY